MTAVDPSTYHQETNDFVAEKRALKIEINRLMAVLLVLSLLANAGSGAANAVLAKIHDIVPLIVAINSDGSHDVLTHSGEMDPVERANTVKAAIITYVRACEGYMFDGAPQDWQKCSAMSSDKRMAEYQQWFASPDGPQAKYGEHANVYIRDIPGGIAFNGNPASTGSISYWRIVQNRGLAAQSAEHWTAQFGFYVRGTVAEADLGFNPLGVTITSFDPHCDGCQGGGT